MKLLPALSFAIALAVYLIAAPGFAQSLSEIRAAANAGDAGAQFALAERYRTGAGVLQNNAAAAAWYERAVAQNEPRAANALGGMLLVGLGVEKDPKRGIALLRDAAASGDPGFMFQLGSALNQGLHGAPEPAAAAEQFRAAAALGHDNAMVSLGLLLQEGSGVAQDFTRALELYQGPAERGHARAQNNLGLLYVRGDGVATDYDAAFAWFQKAAELGLPEGMKNLAVMYENGFGTEVDEDRAAELLRMAVADTAAQELQLVFDARLKPISADKLELYVGGAELGDPLANYYLGHYLLSAEAADIGDYREAARAFKLAAQAGLPAAMANYGMLLFGGRGVLQDFETGYAWLTLAGSLGDASMISLRDKFALQMPVSQVNAAQALAEQLWAEVVEGRP
ncbi:Tetratricopeptide repeat family protein [Candidatus Rhodobacter oscarellae]|uniref:Tetratricopeptide repeat family protein n=1 Tax=Candidatus Rhodobacter oscarellae TaxID=1675527 RepID=A0A0J9GSF9_9RHOB|nr:tetratricopeptide repeat protein [Candidatus Rhodobacter lobularis]KMW56433.1 Tetratricopeptide repeat family protein [Candidatus Rhodobacter lobularis]